MKATGIVRRIDDLGRIIIPKEIRRQIFGTHDASGKPMEFFMSGNDIVLKKYENEIREKSKLMEYQTFHADIRCDNYMDGKATLSFPPGCR